MHPEALVLPPALLCGARVLPDRDALIHALPKGGTWVEVGVGLGVFTYTVHAIAKPDHFTGVDEFRLHELESLWGRPPAAWFGEGHTHESYYRARFATQIAAARMQVLRGDSAACLAQLPDNSADVIYVDADHQYEPVKRDLAVALRKIKPDGWIVVNDYVLVAELHAAHAYGVVYATHEFMIEHDFGMQYLSLQTRMMCDVALRRRQYIPDLTTLADENAALREEIAILRASTSWKLTAPLRALMRRLR